MDSNILNIWVRLKVGELVDQVCFLYGDICMHTPPLARPDLNNIQSVYQMEYKLE